MTLELFDETSAEPSHEAITLGAVILRGFARECAAELLRLVAQITDDAPWRHMRTPSGHRMSVAMTNCGTYGWLSDERGYRYADHDPISGRPWPPMPKGLFELADAAATAAGFAGFAPDACLINRYVPGAKVSLHQDLDERDTQAPIVSISLGIPAVFRFGGSTRKGPTRAFRLIHGDIAVWGGPARHAYHGVDPIPEAQHALTGGVRINLTLRRAR